MRDIFVCLCFAVACRRSPTHITNAPNVPDTSPSTDASPAASTAPEPVDQEKDEPSPEPASDGASACAQEPSKKSFMNLTDVAKAICEGHGDTHAKFVQTTANRWRCTEQEDIVLEARGRFSSRDADEYLFDEPNAESHAGGYHRTHLVRKVNNVYLRIASCAFRYVNFAKALRIRLVDGRELLVGFPRDGHQGVGRTEVKVIGATHDELTSDDLLALPYHFGGGASIGELCDDHSIASFKVREVDAKARELVVTAVQTFGREVSTKDRQGGFEYGTCKLNPATAKKHEFVFAIDANGVHPTQATRVWIEGEGKREWQRVYGDE